MMPIQSINPANGVLLRSFTPLTSEALLEKIALAETAFTEYANVPLSHRELCMRKLAGLLESETGELAALITAEMGKPVVAGARRNRQMRQRLSLLRGSRRPHPCARAGRLRRERSLRTLGPARNRAGGDALELPLLAGLPFPRARAHGW